MAGTLGGVIGHERALADVVGDTGQQQCLEMIVIGTVHRTVSHDPDAT